MKNKIFYYRFILVAFLTALGCNDDFLHDPNPNVQTTATFWETSEDAVLATTAVYAGLQEEGTFKRWLDIAFESRGDLIFSKSPWVEFSNYSKFILPDYNWVLQGEIWHDHYKGIFRANQVLAYVPSIDMDEGLKARLLAETKFLRALYYWNLVNLWGNVPLQLTPSNPNVLPEHAAEAEVWAQIIQDLIEAQPLLPDSYPESELGRATSGAAAALLGKCYMQLHRWAEAEAEFAKIIASGKYDLVQNYGDNFKHTTENNIESLFEIQFSDEFSGPFWDKDLPNTSEGYRRATYFAPRFASGNADAHATPWYLEQFFLEKTVDGEYDPRMDVSFLWNDTTNGQTDPHYYGKSFRDEMTVNVNDIFSRKYLTDYYREVEDEHSPINFRVIRFADVLLMHAEALNELNRTGEAYPFINRVRQRSNLAALETVKPNMSQDEMREQIKHERVLELGGEQVRWTDLKRWGMVNTQEGLATLRERDAEFNTFELGTNHLLPIPTREIDINPSLEQNPGY